MKNNLYIIFILVLVILLGSIPSSYASSNKGLISSPPQNIRVQQKEVSLLITWRRPLKRVNGYRIYRSNAKKILGEIIATINNSKANSFLDSSVQPNKKYYYVVHSFLNAGAESTNKRQIYKTVKIRPSKTSFLTQPSEYISCPTQEEKNQIERDFDIRFYNTTGSTMNWGDYPYQCDSSTFTTTNPTRVKTYNVIRFLKNIQFSRPLPFTQGKSIYEFLTLQTVTNPLYTKLIIEPRLECDIYSMAGGLFALVLSGNFSRWYPVLSGSNTCELGSGTPSNMLVNDFAFHPLYPAELLVHESYHAIIESPHTGTSGGDATIEEMGAWAAQFYFNAWVALYSTNLDDNTKQLAHVNATLILQNRFNENHCPNDNFLKEVVNQIIPNSCF